MRTPLRSATVAFAFSMLALTASECNTDPAGGNGSISDPAVFEAAARESFLPLMAGVSDGLARLLDVIGGGTPDGVTVTPIAGGANATVVMDLDGNGSREASINGSLVGDVATGAFVTVANISTGEPSTLGSGGMSVVETAPGIIQLDNIGGSGETDPAGGMNASQVGIVDGSVSIDLVTGTTTGFMETQITGEEQLLYVTITFEPTGSGGFRIRFNGSGIDFTIP